MLSKMAITFGTLFSSSQLLTGMSKNVSNIPTLTGIKIV